MKLWIAVEVYGLIVQDVHVFTEEQDAKNWFKQYTGTDWDEYAAHPDGALLEAALAEYDQTQIFEVVLEEVKPCKKD